jgi:hypothetical protein
MPDAITARSRMCALLEDSEHWNSGFKSTFLAWMYAVFLFVSSCVGRSLAMGGSSIHGSSMQSYQMSVNKFINPVNRRPWATLAYSETEIQMLICNFTKYNCASVRFQIQRYIIHGSICMYYCMVIIYTRGYRKIS